MDLKISNIILGPWMTDKAYKLNQELKKLVLRVHPHANKPMVKEALEKLFQVKVKNIRIVVRQGKRVRRFRKRETQKPLVKKAIVTLREGFSIDIWNQAGAPALPAETAPATKKANA